MISCVEWIPAGSADPRPKRYEVTSRAERDLVAKMEEAERAVKEEEEEEEAEDAGDIDDNEEEEKEEDAPGAKRTTGVSLPKVDLSSLPADLRMDEYTDDEDEGAAEDRLARVVMEEVQDADMMGGPDREEAEGDRDADDSEDSDDDDDDLADVPDTREFVPTDVAGLEGMGLGGGDVLPADLERMEGGGSGGGGGGNNYGPDFYDEDDASDLDDTNLRSDDRVLLVSKIEDDFASLEVHVYEPSNGGNLYVHHDVPLPSFPLCLAHGDIGPDGAAGNFCAVGTFDKGIEVWNMDVLNALEPSFVLGGEDGTLADELTRRGVLGRPSAPGGGGGKKKKKKKKGRRPPPPPAPPGLRPGSHTDAIMSLSWNRVHRQVLASGSADCTVKVWDVTRAAGGAADGPSKGEDNPCAATFTHHAGKVQSVSWHPSEGSVLATGAFDRTVCLVDARSDPSTKGGVKRAQISGDCEALAWDPHHPQYLTAASEDGVVTTWDVRRFEDGRPVWSFSPHGVGSGPVSDLSYNPSVPGLLATCSADKTVALWDANRTSGEPKACGSRDMRVGRLHTVSFYPSSPWLLGCGGSGNEVALWDLGGDTEEGNSIRGRFGVAPVGKEDKEANNNKVAAEGEEGGGGGEQDFEAKMAAEDAARKAREGGANTAGKNRKNKGRKKKKAHRRGGK